MSRAPITAVRVGLSPDCEFVAHGRYVEVDTDGVTVADVYVPTGEAETDKQVEKERFMVALADRMAELTPEAPRRGDLRRLEHLRDGAGPEGVEGQRRSPGSYRVSGSGWPN